jgi:hypothetical protein
MCFLASSKIRAAYGETGIFPVRWVRSSAFLIGGQVGAVVGTVE